jgi:phosphomannomutase
MATMNPNIFRAYDVRGVYGQDFDAAFAHTLGNRVAAHFQGTIVVGRDGRASSDELAYAVIDGAVHAGAKVIDIGVVSSPQMYWSVRSLGAAAGIMVTASHNPAQYNGFKVIARRGEAAEILDGHHLRQIYDTQEHRQAMHGSVARRDIIGDYAAAVAYAAGWQGGAELHLSVDAPDAVQKTLRDLGPIAPSDRLAVRFDSDGDRIAFYDDGVLIPADFVFLLLVEQLDLQPVVFDLRFSRIVRERLEARGIPHTRSRVGHTFIAQAMQHAGAAFGGEISGHYYWKEFGGLESPELVLLRLYRIVQHSGHTLTELVAPYHVYFKSDELNIPVRDRKHVAAMVHMIAQHFPDGQHSALDGLTVEYPDWWFNIRPSNTEPVMRLIVEAETKDLLDQKVAEILKLTR